MNIHYRPIDDKVGEIVSWDKTHGATEEGKDSHLPGCLILSFEGITDVHPTTHHVDLIAKAVVEKSPGEKRVAALPTVFDVKGAIINELIFTDTLVAAPADRPRKDGLEYDYLPYRKKLRELSGYPTPSEMVKRWPLRPDGTDAVAHLRKRI